MVKKLSMLLGCLIVLSVVVGLVAKRVRGREYTIDELFHEQDADIDLTPITLTELVRSDSGPRTDIEEFVALLHRDSEIHIPALAKVRSNFHLGDAVMLVEVLPFLVGPIQQAVSDTIDEAAGQDFAQQFDKSMRWIWDQNAELHPSYREFKYRVYRIIDLRLGFFFYRQYESKISLSEVVWGGVVTDGIPPLVKPKTVMAKDAAFLADQDVVFGVEINGEARAYPKRILAWHEMVNDTVGGEAINGVYCTLCGSMIAYRSMCDGTQYDLGTSGFLYRSNKLMYDRQTGSLWSTMTGTPVIGSLVGQGLELTMVPVVTTTWQQWQKTHPDTQVLSIDTGHDRDYGEGVAYKDYFATDRLMFPVPNDDQRLNNKDEVLAIDHGWEDNSHLPMAVSAKFLSDHPVHHETYAGQPIVILTDGSGANRVYDAGGNKFERWVSEDSVMAADGTLWSVGEEELMRQPAAEDQSNAEDQSAGPTASLPRVPAHRAFWFGWHAAHPDTRLVF